MKCFSCGVYGHTKLKCTNNKVTEQNETEPRTPSEQVAPAIVNGIQDGSDKTDERAESDSLSKGNENPKEDALISHTENVGKCSVNTNECVNVRSAASGESETVAAGNIDSAHPMEPDKLVGVGESRDSQASVGLSQVDVDQLSEGGSTGTVQLTALLIHIGLLHQRYCQLHQSSVLLT
ncbi:hypothetical protein ROHU_033481 [Labeo rohita]|uniref:CCHC-type domain-containing protein n=1 Tax=Labeo rohita TaxID=84645 RepID=A0A498LED8_LABRO|nr:hypothetical protein ROHU_033481 [Labeo rohita]